MKKFFRELLKPNSGTSSRRFLAILSWPFMIYGTVIGMRYGVQTGRFDFFFSSLLTHVFMLYIAYGFFKDKDIINTITSVFSKKKVTEETTQETTDEN